MTANDDPPLIARAETLISMTRSNMGDAGYDAGSLLKQKQMYEAEARKCESSIDAVQFGATYAEIIRKTHHRGVESARLFMKLREICQRVHGSDHKLTKLVHSKRSELSSVWMTSEVTGDPYLLYDYDGSFEKFVGFNKRRRN